MQSNKVLIGVGAVAAVLTILAFGCSLFVLGLNYGREAKTDGPSVKSNPPPETSPPAKSMPTSKATPPTTISPSFTISPSVTNSPSVTSSPSVENAKGAPASATTKGAKTAKKPAPPISNKTSTPKTKPVASTSVSTTPTLNKSGTPVVTSTTKSTPILISSTQVPSTSPTVSSTPVGSGVWNPGLGGYGYLPPLPPSMQNQGWGLGTHSIWIWFLNWNGGNLGNGANPKPKGKPFQIESVKVTAGWKYNDSFAIDWTVSGNEDQIQEYVVSLFVTRPDKKQPYYAEVMRAHVKPGKRSCVGKLDLAPVSIPFHYLSPVVVAIPKNPKKTPHKRIGPARAVVPGLKSVPGAYPLSVMPLDLWPMFTRVYKVKGTQTSKSLPISLGGQVLKPGAAVWPAGQLQSHNAILFDRGQPTWNLVARPAKGDDELGVAFVVPKTKGRYRFFAFIGFAGKAGRSNEMDIQMECFVGGSNQGKHNTSLKVKAGSPPPPLKFFTAKIDTAKVSPGNQSIAILFTFKGGDKDPKFAPAIFGARMIPERAMNKINWAGRNWSIPASHPVLLADLRQNPFTQIRPVMPASLPLSQFPRTNDEGAIR